MKEKKTLTPKQIKFIQEYLIDLNATQAAIRAGYSKKTANVLGCQLLTKFNIQAEISKRQAEQGEKIGLNAQWVLNNLKEVSERCMQKIPVMKFDRTEKCMMPVKNEEGGDTWTFDSSGANRALELLGKHLGMFHDKLDVALHSWDDLEREIAGDKKQGHKKDGA